jgi:homoserine dehydrogenase
MRTVGVGLLGAGVVGSAVAAAIREDNDMADRSGVKLELRKVAVRDQAKQRPVSLPKSILTTDTQSVVEARDVDIVVEVLGWREACVQPHHRGAQRRQACRNRQQGGPLQARRRADGHG